MVPQGIDPTLLHPAPKSEMLSDRFVIFSGGKLEYRKGQDLVIAAFRQFQARHPEALLLTAGHHHFSRIAQKVAQISLQWNVSPVVFPPFFLKTQVISI